jgi:outer membrane protein assembly factor BamB
MTTAARRRQVVTRVGVDLESGAIRHNLEVFKPAVPVPINEKNSHASPSPVVEPGHLYVHFGAMGTACLDTGDGRVLWRNNDLVVDHKEGPGSSPILFENLLFVNCDGQDQQYVAALDKRTGKPIWRTNRSAPFREKPDFRKAYATPVIIQVDGKPQLVSPGADQVESYDPQTGRELWRVRYQGFSNVPVPLFQDGMIYLCTGYTTPELWAIRANGSGDVTDTHVVWRFKKQVSSNPSPVLVGGRIFLAGDRGVATCVDAKEG